MRLWLAAGLAAALAVDAVDDAAAGNSVLVTAGLLFQVGVATLVHAQRPDAPTRRDQHGVLRTELGSPAVL